MALSYNLGYQESISVHPTRVKASDFCWQTILDFPQHLRMTHIFYILSFCPTTLCKVQQRTTGPHPRWPVSDPTHHIWSSPDHHSQSIKSIVIKILCGFVMKLISIIIALVILHILSTGSPVATTLLRNRLKMLN